MNKFFLFLCVILLSFGIVRIANAQNSIIHLEDDFPWSGRGPVGQGQSQDTYGQTFTVNADTVLSSFTFILDDSNTNVEFIAFVMKWDGAKAIDDPLFEADGSTVLDRDFALEEELAGPIDGVVDTNFWNTWKAITIDTTIGSQGVDLIPGEYIVFFTTADHCDDAAGMGVYDHVGGVCNSNTGDSFHNKSGTWYFFHLNWGPEPTSDPLVDFPDGNLVQQNSFNGSFEQFSSLTTLDWFNDTGFVGGSYFGSDAAFVLTFGSSSNAAPIADAVVEQLKNIGSTATVSLDGSSSSDPDDPLSSLTFTWTVDQVVICDGIEASCGSTVADMAYGTHEVVLRVTDPSGNFDEVAVQVTIDPAQLSVFHIDEAEVEFEDYLPEIEVSGEIGLPFGVGFSELTPQATVVLDLAGINVLPYTPVTFVIEGKNGKEWKFKDESAAIGITKFKIDWKGARYKFNDNSFPIKLKSKLITTTETILTVKLKAKDIEGPFAIDIGGQASVSFDSNGVVTSSTIPFEEKKPGKKVTLALPFPLLNSTIITLSGSVEREILVGDDLKGSVGRFSLDATFDGSILPDDVSTTPRSLDLAVTVGTVGYTGAASLGPDDLKVRDNEWETEDD